MKNLLTYEDFMLVESRRVLNESLSINHRKTIFEAFCKSPFLTIEEKLLAEAVIETEQWDEVFEGVLNEESIAAKLKAKAQAAMQVVKDKGKKYLSDTQEVILKMGGTIKGVISKIMGVVKAFMAKAWEWIKSQVESGYAKSKEKIVSAAAGKFKGKADVAKDEIKNLGSMANATAKWCLGISGEMEGGMAQAAEVKESYILAIENALYFSASELIVESEEFVNYLRESEGHDSGPKIPFLSALSHKLANFQPFKALHDIEHKAGDAANKGLSGVSSVLTKVAGAPGPFEFTIVGAIFALVTGYAIKHGVTHLIKEMGVSAFGAVVMAALPGIGVVLLCMKYAAKGIWVVGICETALSIALKSDDEHHEEDHDEEKHDEENKKQSEEE